MSQTSSQTSSDMKGCTQLADLSDRRQHRHHYYRRGKIDNECSTDSGCSSDGSTGSESGERLSHRDSSERLCRSSRSPQAHCYLEQLRKRPTRSQERLSGSAQRSLEDTWSPSEDVRSLSRGSVSPSSCSSSPSKTHSSSDTDSLKRFFTTKILRCAFQNLKIMSSKCENNKEKKKHAKKSPKRILRSPVLYMYVRGVSGLPTQRVPRNSGLQQQTIQSYSCQDLTRFY